MRSTVASIAELISSTINTSKMEPMSSARPDASFFDEDAVGISIAANAISGGRRLHDETQPGFPAGNNPERSSDGSARSIHYVIALMYVDRARQMNTASV